MSSILTVKDLRLYYTTRKGVVKAVDGVSFDIRRGETLAVVGESGCGKTSLARALIRLLPRNIHTFDGSVVLDNRELMKLSEEEFRRQVQWSKISMVFQGAQNSLNPVLRVGFQIAEPLVIHKGVPREEALAEARKYLRMVGVHESFADRYPFELSGGMKQRAIIAMALITRPYVMILDEPTSALDVITQANIMNLLKSIKDEWGVSYIFITHDIALSSELADKVMVMYAGHMVELTTSEEFYTNPQHPYSQKLMASVPSLRADKKLEFIPGAPPSLISPPPGCRFHPRCPYVMDVCRSEEPPNVEVKPGHVVKCWLYAKGG
ncbi:MAG: ABC transporter ATP-binding protein [Thermofilaceae archaeon]|nr:ABC transporter ATP-binding protein [Thermofilaceae archaeon]MCX8180735.1 ABC transporter ATP-binding protein [Thermofilaceae archaeon]MDW8003954.1 ABC transporter ATP-binding protein [Thermofilaceae archaeon]